MADTVYSWFQIESPLETCFQTPAIPEEDQCKIKVKEASKDQVFILQRKGRDFFPIDGTETVSAQNVAKSYPSYQPPMRELMDFLALKKKFNENFGDLNAPHAVMDQAQIAGMSREETLKAVYKYFEFIINFISHGRIFPGNALMEEQLEKTIKAAIFIFADPALGKSVIKILQDIKSDPIAQKRLSPESQKRMDWILSINTVRETFWHLLRGKMKMDSSGELATSLKRSSTDLLVFLFANHMSTEAGLKDLVFSGAAKEAAEVYHRVMSKDPMHDAGKNYYQLMANLIPQLKNIKVPNTYGKVYQKRINTVFQAYRTAADDEMKRLLAAMDPKKAFREYLLIKYGDTSYRRVALKIILSHTTIDSKGDPPVSVDMGKASRDLKDWFNQQRDLSQRRDALRAIEFMLTKLFHRGEEIEVYWDKNYQEQLNFYEGIEGRVAYERFITWWRLEAERRGLKPSEPAKIREKFRGTTFIAELAVGVLGTSAALFCPIKGETGYYACGGAAILGGGGIGAALGNGGQCLTDSSSHKWAWDTSGATAGGAAGGIIYFKTVPKPGSRTAGPNGNPTDPTQKTPGPDEYGP